MAARAYISLARVAPVGVRFTRTSALASARTLVGFEGLASLRRIFSPAIGEMPSSGCAIWTLTPRWDGWMNLRVLFNSWKRAVERSLPSTDQQPHDHPAITA